MLHIEIKKGLIKNPKNKKNLSSELKFKAKKRSFVNLCTQKMRDNLYNEDDPQIITKKFYSHLKSSSKSSRIPECMNLNGCFRNDSSGKAELFKNIFLINSLAHLTIA